MKYVRDASASRPSPLANASQVLTLLGYYRKPQAIASPANPHPGSRKKCYPAALRRISIAMSTEKATFGAGCFWGVEAAFAAIPGVTATAVGYEGGQLERPSYKDVCTDSTGHAEVVELDFDPAVVSFERLLDAFFTLHDPTTLNRQGPDWGTQYRSAIFFHSSEQEAQANAKIEQLTATGQFKPRRIVTKVEPAQTFWRAEEYHQRYLEKRGLASCHI